MHLKFHTINNVYIADKYLLHNIISTFMDTICLCVFQINETNINIVINNIFLCTMLVEF